MEPTRQTVRAIMSLRRAAHLQRSADKETDLDRNSRRASA
jgi:hypothetical protein